MQAIADRAVEGISMVETVLVARRTDARVPMQSGREFCKGGSRQYRPFAWKSTPSTKTLPN